MGVPISNVTRRVVYEASGTGPYNFSFEILANTDIAVYKDDTLLTLTTDYTVTINANGTGSVTLTASPTGATQIAIVGNRTISRSTDFVTGGDFFANTLNDELDQQTIFAQQNAEGLDRALKAPQTDPTTIDMTLPRAADRAGKYLAFDEDGNPEPGPTSANVDDVAAIASEIVTVAGIASNVTTVADNNTRVTTVANNISNVNTVGGISGNVTTVAGISSNVTSVAGNASNINTVAGISSAVSGVAAISSAVTAVNSNSTNINTVATNISSVNTAATNIAAIIDAPNQASAAAASAASAAASAASGMYSSVQDKSANYTVVSGDAGDLIRVTTSAGARTITLPSIAATGIGDGFKIAVVKWTGDGNAVTVSRSSSDTINGATSYTLGNQYSSATFVADAETNTWFAAASGLGTTNVNVDVFSGNGSTTAFTLSGDPGSKNNTLVAIGGVYQAKATYSVSGTTLTFTAAPPSGTSNIEVVWNAPLAIGTPSDDTVSTAKLQASAVTTAKIADSNVTTAKIADANVTAAKIASGAAVSNIGYTPVNKAGDTMSGDLTISKSADNSRLWLESAGGSGKKYGFISTTTGFLTLYENGAGNNKFAINPSGQMCIGGDPFNASGAKLQSIDGITFPATQVASSDANTLDDYEEGTWTLSSLSAGFTITSGNVGSYVKIGKQVTFTCYFQATSSLATGSSISIGGLPFVSIGYASVVCGYQGNAVGGRSSAGGYTESGQSWFNTTCVTNSGSALGYMFTGTYFVS